MKNQINYPDCKCELLGDATIHKENYHLLVRPLYATFDTRIDPRSNDGVKRTANIYCSVATISNGKIVDGKEKMYSGKVRLNRGTGIFEVETRIQGGKVKFAVKY